MNEIITFFAKYGLILTLIAVVGVIILGIMKYCNLFKKLPEKSRHYVYLIISIGLSVIATIIYLLIVGQFEITYFLAIAAAIYAINQTAYNFFKVTTLDKAFEKLLDLIKRLIKKTPGKPDE